MLEDANARAAASAAAALSVARIGDALMARLEQLQTADAPAAPVGLLNAMSLPPIGSPVVLSPYGLMDAPVAPAGRFDAMSSPHAGSSAAPSLAGPTSPVGRTLVTTGGPTFGSPVSPFGNFDSGSPLASRGPCGPSPLNGPPLSDDIPSPVSSAGSGRTTLSSGSAVPPVPVCVGGDAPPLPRDGTFSEDGDGRRFRQSDSDKLDATKREAGVKSLFFRRMCDEETYAIAFLGDRDLSSRAADSVILFDHIVLHTEWLQDTFLFQSAPSTEQLADSALSPWECSMVKAMPLILPGPRQCPLFASPDKGASKQFKVLMGLLPWRGPEDLWVSAFHSVAVTDERAQLANMELIYQVVFGVHVKGLFADAITALESSLIDTNRVPPRYVLWLWVRQALPTFYNAMLRTRRDAVTGRPIDYAGGGWKLLGIWRNVAATYVSAMTLASYKDVRDSDRYAAFEQALDAASTTHCTGARSSDRKYLVAGKRDRSVSPASRLATSPQEPAKDTAGGESVGGWSLCVRHALYQLDLVKDNGDPWPDCSFGDECKWLHPVRAPTRVKVMEVINSEDNHLPPGLKKSALASLQAN